MAKSKTAKRGGSTLKSSLETYCYDRLKAEKIDFTYEETFQLTPSMSYNATYFKSKPKTKEMVSYKGKKILPITYKPDFVSHKHKFIIETKGFVRANDSFPLRWKLFIAYLISAGMSDYSLFIPKNREQVDFCINEIKKTI